MANGNAAIDFTKYASGGPIDFTKYTAPSTSGVPPVIAAAAQPASTPSLFGDIKSISPAPPSSWLNDLESDIRYGTGTTLPGRILGKEGFNIGSLHIPGLGATGVNRGVSEGTANEMAPLQLGGIKLAKGIAETPEHQVMGPLHAAAGALQMAGPALQFVAPETTEVPEAATAARTLMMRRALRPAGKPAGKFAQNVADAWGAIQGEIKESGIPTTLEEFDNLLKSAKQRFWGQSQELLQQAQGTKPTVKGLLPSPEAAVQTGVQKVVGEAPGAVIPAERRPVVPEEPSLYRTRDVGEQGIPYYPESHSSATTTLADAERLSPSRGATTGQPQQIVRTPLDRVEGFSVNPGPNGVPWIKLHGEVPEAEIGRVPSGEQFLSGGAHPELSGHLTNPATLLTRDTAQLSATRDRLASVVNDADQFSKLGPGEQEAYLSQLSRLNKLLEPGPALPYGPTIDGSAVADAINKSIRPRPKLLGSSVVDELQSRAAAYQGRKIPLEDAEQLLQDANREASSWYHSPDPHGPHLQASAAAEASAIRDQLYKQIDSLTKSSPGTAATLKRTYGALDALHDFTSKRIPVASRQAPLNLSEVLSLGGGAALAAELLHSTGDIKSLLAAPVPWAAAKIGKHVNSPEFLLQHALQPSSQLLKTTRAGVAPAVAAASSGKPAAAQRNKTLGAQAADHVEDKFPGYFTGRKR